MAFTRRLSQPFVAALNRCCEEPRSWWRKIADDPDAFIAIRNNCLNVYVSGGSLLKITYSRRQGLVCSIHEEYLIIRSPRAYVKLTRDETPKVDLVHGTDGLADHYRTIKRRIARFSHAERAGENAIASRLPRILDMEAAFSWGKGDGRRGRVGRVDLVALAPSGSLVLIEAKLFTNSELRDGHRPSVIDQLADYQKWLREDRQHLVAAYRVVLDLYRRLRGRFFQERAKALSDTSVLDVHDRPRLLIFGFNQRQKRAELRRVIDGICRGPERADLKMKDIVAVGNPRNVTARNLLGGA